MNSHKTINLMYFLKIFLILLNYFNIVECLNFNTNSSLDLIEPPPTTVTNNSQGQANIEKSCEYSSDSLNNSNKIAPVDNFIIDHYYLTPTPKNFSKSSFCFVKAEVIYSVEEVQNSVNSSLDCNDQVNKVIKFKNVTKIEELPYCCEGYEVYKHDKTKCVPSCKNCKNGFCVEPNKCECFPGFVKSLNGDCVETCPFSCLNGVCHSNGTCICNEGYKYPNNEINKFCVPHCTYSCGIKMNCTSPDTCECKKKYRLTQGNDCEPICEPKCGLGGTCISPGVCQCNLQDYLLINGTCQAKCSGGCENGRCASHENCVCDSGWALTSSKNKCTPICSNCKHGKCVAPQKCACYKGYIFDEKEKQCVPHCDKPCINANCVEPNKCKCFEGYNKSLHFPMCIRLYKRKRF